MIVRMWEARCEPGLVDDVLTWARAVGAEALLAGASAAEVYRSDEDRVVLITRWSGPTDWEEPTALPDAVLRAQAWPFMPA
jgi:hypothetical protein